MQYWSKQGNAEEPKPKPQPKKPQETIKKGGTGNLRAMYEKKTAEELAEINKPKIQPKRIPKFERHAVEEAGAGGGYDEGEYYDEGEVRAGRSCACATT